MKTMKTWSHMDKTEWGEGAWQEEPDKAQWVDEATGLDCLAVRNRFGAWCGYVGVPESHPLFGVGYSECPQGCEDYCDHAPDARYEVHGGLTFSGECQEPTEREWADEFGFLYEKGKLHLDEEDITKLATGEVPGYLTWREQMMAKRICHEGHGGGAVWWFGFDCAHAFDLAPDMYSKLRCRPYEGDVYRTLDYVKAEVTRLAAQLQEPV